MAGPVAPELVTAAGPAPVTMARDLGRDEFREAFERHREAVFRFLWRLAGNAHDAEDLLQETFVRFWRKGAQYRGEGHLLAYLRKIAFRTWQNANARLSARRPPLPLREEALPGTGGGMEALEDRDARGFLRVRVREALRTLPQGAREAFLLFRFEGMKVAEVAEVTGAPVKTVESRLRRAHRHLADRLRRYKDQLLPR